MNTGMQWIVDNQGLMLSAISALGVVLLALIAMLQRLAKAFRDVATANKIFADELQGAKDSVTPGLSTRADVGVAKITEVQESIRSSAVEAGDGVQSTVMAVMDHADPSKPNPPKEPVFNAIVGFLAKTDIVGLIAKLSKKG